MVVPSLIAIALMLAVGYVWSSRGFFSALLNLLVTVAAGAIAFALWETVATAAIKNVANDNRFVIDIVWGGSLVALFVLSMAVLSLAVNAVVRANIKVHKVTDWVGGAVCGLAAGLIVSGISLIGTSQIRTAEIDNLLQFSPVDYDNNGYLTRRQLWVPTDTWTAGLYKFWSERSLRETLGGGKTLGAWRPQVADEGHLLRIAETDVLLRYSLNPKDVKLGGRYTVGKSLPKGMTPPAIKDLVGDTKPVATTDGRQFKGRAYIEGWVVGFEAGAKEKGGQVAIGAGSATLVCRNRSDTASLALQPIAVISQAKGDSLQEGRWRFDTKNFFVGSMGGQANVGMAFEFLVPDEYADQPDAYPEEVWHPIALYVRGVRFDLTDPADPDKTIKPSAEYMTPADRNAAVEGGGFLRSIADAAPPLVEPAQVWKMEKNDPNQALRLNNRIPGSIVLNGGEMSGVDLSKGQQIINCVDYRTTPKALADIGVDRSLRVEEFQPGPGTAVISIEVSRDVPKFSATEPESTGATGAPTLVDNLGQRYQAVGFVYRDRNEIKIRFTPGSPLASLNDAPSVSRSRDDQKLFLIFRVAPGVRITQYAIGTTGIVTLRGVEVPTNQQNK
ncbi:MAG: hypothetical protein K2Q09_02990 [Phycisphaerales bacterium]|nr:hypothetical protein [Phycisphaerales bacterium]